MIDFSVYKPVEKEVYAYRCPECGTLYHPVPMICRKCHNRRDPSGVLFSVWDRVPLRGLRAKLLTWTRLYALPTGYQDPSLLFGVVEFENGLRASGRLRVEEPVAGMELIAGVGLVRERIGRDVYGFIFEEHRKGLKK